MTLKRFIELLKEHGEDVGDLADVYVETPAGDVLDVTAVEIGEDDKPEIYIHTSK